jgi:hypothetical protein
MDLDSSSPIAWRADAPRDKPGADGGRKNVLGILSPVEPLRAVEATQHESRSLPSNGDGSSIAYVLRDSTHRGSVWCTCHATAMIATFGPIQRVLIRGSHFELEDKIRALKATADDGGADSDVGSIDADVARMQSELIRLRRLLSQQPHGVGARLNAHRRGC